MTGTRRSLLIGAAALPLAGCAAGSLIPKAEERPSLYVLTPKSTFPENLPSISWQLAVDTPQAPAGIDTPRIALMHQPVQLDYYARANWTDRAPIMVQSLLIESFENTGKIVGVGRMSVNLRADYVLATELREFQVEYYKGGLPQAHVRINAKLVKFPERAIIGNTTAENSIEAAADTMADIIPAFDEALGKSLRDIVVWTLGAMQPL